MGYTVKFNTTIEWEIKDEDIGIYGECDTPEDFIKYQEYLINGVQSLEDFVANAVIKKGHWEFEREYQCEDMGEWEPK
jgi:hypothetical protein